MPAPALAVSSGVHVDPGSPPGKEYAIPLVAARSQGDQEVAPPRPVNPPAAGLFGAGVSPARPPAPRARRRVVAPLKPRPAPAVPAADRARPSGTSPLLWVGAALALLVPGLALGIGVRRWRHA